MENNKQIFPEFDADLLIMGEKDFLKLYADEVLIKKLAEINLKVDIKENDREKYNSGDEWILNFSFFNLYIRVYVSLISG